MVNVTCDAKTARCDLGSSRQGTNSGACETSSVVARGRLGLSPGEFAGDQNCFDPR